MRSGASTTCPRATSSTGMSATCAQSSRTTGASHGSSRPCRAKGIVFCPCSPILQVPLPNEPLVGRLSVDIEQSAPPLERVSAPLVAHALGLAAVLVPLHPGCDPPIQAVQRKARDAEDGR